MAKKRRRLRLVSSHDPASVFDDLDALRRAQAVPAGPAFKGQRRQRITETFARIPHDRGLALGRRKLSNAAWVLLIILDRLIFEGRGRNPIKLTHRSWKATELSHDAMTDALRQLEAAGVVSVEHRPGRAPRVTHLWFPVTQDLRSEA